MGTEAPLTLPSQGLRLSASFTSALALTARVEGRPASFPPGHSRVPHSPYP